jgi:hypothetical protein
MRMMRMMRGMRIMRKMRKTPKMGDDDRGPARPQPRPTADW